MAVDWYMVQYLRCSLRNAVWVCKQELGFCLLAAYVFLVNHVIFRKLLHVDADVNGHSLIARLQRQRKKVMGTALHIEAMGGNCAITQLMLEEEGSGVRTKATWTDENHVCHSQTACYIAASRGLTRWSNFYLTKGS